MREPVCSDQYEQAEMVSIGCLGAWLFGNDRLLKMSLARFRIGIYLFTRLSINTTVPQIFIET